MHLHRPIQKHLPVQMFQLVAVTFGHLSLAGEQDLLPVIIQRLHGDALGTDGCGDAPGKAQAPFQALLDAVRPTITGFTSFSTHPQ